MGEWALHSTSSSSYIEKPNIVSTFNKNKGRAQVELAASNKTTLMEIVITEGSYIDETIQILIEDVESIYYPNATYDDSKHDEPILRVPLKSYKASFQVFSEFQ